MRSRGGKVNLKSTPEQLRAAGILLDGAPAAGLLDLTRVFGNPLPVEVEIGPGKGGFLLSRAKARPELNLLGIEWLPRYALYAADRVFRARLDNVRVLCADADAIFSTQLPARSLWRVHVYFPDPWPKARQRRRRLLKPHFVSHLRRTLRLGGCIGIVTDHAEYARQVRWTLSNEPGLAQVPFVPATGAPCQGAFAGSNFERKYAIEGRKLWAVACLRYA